MALESLQQGRYRILRLLGNGSMGEVYLVEDTRINRQVAIKVIRTEANPYPGSVENLEASRLFEREAKSIARLNHPNILSLYDFGEEVVNGVPLTYMVMPYAADGSLFTWLQQRGSPVLPPQDVAHFVREAADALQNAHDNGIIHQDVKPQNFLIRRNSGSALPDLLLADFGISRLAAGTSNSSQAIRGTPLYMAPEQWEGQPVPASDQYSLAVMAYQLLTGRTPFQGGPSQMMFQHFNMSPMPPSAVNPALGPEIDTVLLRALAKRPEARYPTVTAFADAFQQAVMMDVSTYVRPGSASMMGSTWIPPVAGDSQPFNTSGPTILQNNQGGTSTGPTILQNGAGAIDSSPTVLSSSGRFGSAPVGYPPVPPTPPFGTPGTRPPQEPQRTSRTLGIVILVIVLVLLLGSIGGAVFYFQHAASARNGNATATANANGTLTALNNQSATAGSNGLTATAQSNLTATAGAQQQSSSNATATATASDATQTATTQNNVNQNATATAVAATATAGATPFTVQSVAMSVNPQSINGDTCGSMITVTYTATFTASGLSGGTVQFTYTTDNGHSNSGPQTLTFSPGQTTKTFQFTSQGTLSSGGTFPGVGIVQVTSPNNYTSQGIQPTGTCS